MIKKTFIIFLNLILITNFPLPAWAETVLEKIERTGVIDAGTRKNAAPFAYTNIQGKWTGYSLELLQLIQQQLQQKLNKPIKLNLREITIDNRFSLVQQGKLDIVCEATSITYERLKTVDFSLPFFMTGTQFLLKKEHSYQFNINGTLAHQKIAYIPNTTTDQIIRQIYPQAIWKAVGNRSEGIQKLKKNEVQAIASDGILLLGELLQQGGDLKQFSMVPIQPMTTELYGCILPKNDSAWKEMVDQVIASEDDQKLQEKWFNADTGIVPYSLQTLPNP